MFAALCLRGRGRAKSWLLLLATAAFGLVFFLSRELVRKGEEQRLDQEAIQTHSNAQEIDSVGASAETSVFQKLASKEGADPAESSRQEAALPVLAGRVLSKEGLPIAGATLSWTSLDASDLEWEPAWQSDDWGPLDRPTIWTTSDTSGRFFFEELPAAELASGSVIWATHVDHQADCLLLSPEDQLAGVEQTIRLDQNSAILVRVEDAAKQAVPSAYVHQYGLTPTFAVPEGGQSLNEERARRYFWRTIETDETGTARLGAFPGEQILVAEKDGKRSIPWRGPRRDEVVLRLVDGFTVGGRVFLPDWGHLNYEGERRITIAARRDNIWYTLATLRRVHEGQWGPIDLPIIEGARYRIHLEGSPIIPVMVEFEPPSAPSELFFDLEAELGHEIWIQAIDEEGNPVPTAQAVVWWMDNGKRNFVRRRSRPDGYINPWSLPRGTIYILVEAPGYVTEMSDAFEVPMNATVEWVLKRGGRLRGRCLHEGNPVEDFEIVLWQADDEYDKQTHLFHGRKDGSFELDSVPLGEVFLKGSAESLIGREPARTRVAQDATAEVIVELFSPVVGRGVVVDEQTGGPISTATVQPQVMGERRALGPWGEPFPVRQDGTFEVPGFVPGTNIVSFQAPGYAERIHTFFAEGEASIDLGRIALARPQPLVIQLKVEGVPEIPVDFSAFRAYSSVEPILPETSFSPEGWVRFDDQRPGFRGVWIEGPGPGWSRLMIDLRSGEDWQFTHRVAGWKYLGVEVFSTKSETLELARAVLVSYQNSEGISTNHGIPLPPTGVVKLEGIDAETVSVDVLDSDWKTIASAQGSFDGKNELHLTIPLGEDAFLFHVVDEEGLAVPSTTVFVNDSQPSSLLLIGTTDSQGECFIHGVPERPILVHLTHQTRGTRHGIPCDGAAGEAELVLENDAQLSLIFRDADTPVTDVSCRLVNPADVSLTHSRNADAQGLLTWTGLSAGSYRVSASHPECWPVTIEAMAREDAEPVPVQIRRLGNLAIDIQAANGLPVAGQEIELRSIEFGEDVSDWLAEQRVTTEEGLVSDLRGRIRLFGLPRGLYGWRLVTIEGEAFEGEIEVLPRETAEITLALP